MRTLAPALFGFCTLALVGCGAGRIGDDGPPAVPPRERSLVCGSAGPRGVDVSHYQGAIDWSAAASSGIAFAIASVGDGSYQDPAFATNWPAMRAAGLVRGAYQFFEPGEDATMQANLLLAMMGSSLGAGDLPPTLDVEVTGGQSPGAICADVQTWIDVVESATHRTPIIYTGEWFWDPSVGCGAFAGNPLWVADYGDACPDLPAAWSSYAIWQDSSTGSVPGIGGVDTDVFNGSLADLAALAGGGTGGSGSGGGTTGGSSGPSCAGLNDALYCGSDHVNGDPSTLYQCAGHAIVATTPCAAGCTVEPDGTNDYCTPLCGNGVCETGESCTSCPTDCGSCGGGSGGGSSCTYSCAAYGYSAGQCVSGWYCDGSCISYTGCASGPVCGDGVCESGEDCTSCPTDCGSCGGSGGGSSCTYTCAAYGYSAGQCVSGWYCDGSCISYTGCM